MPAIKIKWSQLLKITELEFIPEAPKLLSVSDELIQALSWLTGATNNKRLLLRCTEQGAMLVADAWSLLTSVETDELTAASGSPDTFTATVPNKGVLLAVGLFMIKATFTKVSGGSTEVVYIPADTFYWYPHPTYSVEGAVVPDPGGIATLIGVTALN